MKKILLLALIPVFSLSAQTASDYVAELPDANGIAFDSKGNLYIADNHGENIIKITPAMVQSSFVKPNSNPDQLIFDPNDNLWVTETKEVAKITAGGIATSYTTDSPPFGIAIDANGNVFYSEPQSNKIKKISTTGAISTFFYDPNTLKKPTGIIFDKAGNLIVADESDKPLKKINPAGVLTEIPSSLQKTTAEKILTFASNGDLYIVSDHKIFRLPVANTNGNLIPFYDPGSSCGIYGMTIYNKNLYVSLYDQNNQKGKVVKIVDPALGVEGNKPITESITVYPNPAIDYLYVESKNEVVKTVELYDMTGRVVKSYKTLDVKGNKIALPGLTSGNYILKINNTSKKIIIK